MLQPLLLSAGCIPALILLAVAFIERWRRKHRGERQPLSEKLLRPAGYSLQRKLEDLNDSFMTWFMGAFLFSFLVVIFPQTRPADVWSPFFSVVCFGVIAASCAVMAMRKLYQIRKYRMGLLGEQAMAERLQPLFADGYRVFHDFHAQTANSNGTLTMWSSGWPASLPSKPSIARKCREETASRISRAVLPHGPKIGAAQQRRPTAKFPVRPDFVFSKSRLAIFVDGCFWHGCPRHATQPKNNQSFWRKKLAGNKARDRRVNRGLRSANWQVIRFWECAVQNAMRNPRAAERMVQKIKEALR